MLKGRMAESLVEELFKLSGHKIYRFGYESVLQNLTQVESNFEKHNDVAEKIRAIPDFIAIDSFGKPIFLEVKFRWSPKTHENDVAMLERINQFWPSTVVFVNCSERPYFRVSHPPYLNSEKEIVFEPLKDLAGFKIDMDAIENTEKLIDKYFSSTIKTHDLQNKNLKVKFNPVEFRFSSGKFSKIEKIVKKMIKF